MDKVDWPIKNYFFVDLILSKSYVVPSQNRIHFSCPLFHSTQHKQSLSNFTLTLCNLFIYFMPKNNQVANADDSEHFSDIIQPPYSQEPSNSPDLYSQPNKPPLFPNSTSHHNQQPQKQSSPLENQLNQPIKLKKQSLKQAAKNDKIRRVKQNIFWYLFTIISTVLLGIQNIYVYFWDYDSKDLAILFPSLLVRIILFLFSTYHLTSNFRLVLKLYFSFDKVLLTAVAFSIGVVGFQTVYLPFSIHEWVQYALCVIYPIAIFLHAGHFRVVLVHVDWTKCQTVIMKVALLIGGSSCFGLSLYYTILGVNFVKQGDLQTQEMIRNFIFLFAFAGFDFYLQSFSLMDDIDGTTKFKNEYHLQCPDENLEALLKSSGKKKKIEKQEVMKRESNLMPIRKIETYMQNQEAN